MKIKTALKTIVIFLSLFFFCFQKVNAQGQIEIDVDQFEVNIRASVNTDLHSRLSTNPSTVEIYQPSTVIVNMLNPSGTGKPGRKIELYIDGNSAGATLIQPSGFTDSSGKTTGMISSTVPGTYTICARDITDSMVIDIVECTTLYVVPVPAPVMIELPQYTRGNSNSVMWDMPGAWSYEYYVEVSLTSTFETVLFSSGWIDNRSFQFHNLENEKMYFYRVKARNLYGGESDWSNVVFTVQDSLPPVVELISISKMDEGTVEDWDSNYVITIKYRITDNVGVGRIEFWCLNRKGVRYNCKHTSTLEGDFFTVSIKLSNLERNDLIYLYRKYGFCVEAVDLVGNVTRNCDALLEIPFTIRSPMRTLDDSFDIAIDRIKPRTLRDLSVSVSLVNVAFSLATLLLAFGYFPYLLVQLFLALQTLFGIRKMSKTAGFVYNSFTKEPVPLAMVRVFNENDNVIWWDITDRNGYYLLPQLEEGIYRIDVVAKNYIFPSKVIFGKTDFPLENVYHGKEFEIKDEKIPSFAIPIDEEDLSRFEEIVGRFLLRTKRVWKVLHIILFIFGLFLSLYVMWIMDVWWNYLIIASYIFAGLTLFFNLFNKKDRYGQVLDENSEPVEGAMIYLNEEGTGRVVSRRVTDRLGRYRFVVGSGVYNLAVMNSNLKLVDEEGVSGIVVETKKEEVVTPKILIRRLEDTTGVEDVIEPLKEL